MAVVYWSGTGNTEAMAQKVAEGARAAGAQVDIFEANGFHAASLKDYSALAFGCPAMGDEVLEESVFQPMWEEVRGKLGGKKIGLFGSYGWGCGEWMQSWEKDADEYGANVVDTVIANDYPDDEAGASCESLGKTLAS